MTISLSACTTAKKTQEDEATAVPVNDFPTQDRVEYVLECIEKRGGLRYETLYPCICSIDKIATQMSYKEYAEAKTFTFMRSTPGEKGGIFRDVPKAEVLRKKLEAAQKYAEESCFVKM
jgi:hypothetical protein